MESTDSSCGSKQPQLPPGFRFHPTDEELVVHYLMKKAASAPLPVAIIAEVDLYKFDPWELPAKATFGEEEWYFFSPRDRKYPNGARPNRAATSGYWKATGTDKPVLTSGGTQKVGVKKALVFYGGKPPKGAKTNWIMHEYRLADNNNNNKTVAKPAGFDPTNKKASLRLDDWVLCRIYKKNNLQRPVDSDGSDHTMTPAGMMLGSIPPSISGFNPTVEINHDHRTMLNSSNVNMITTSNFLPVKRSLPGLFWNEEGHTKRLLSESNSNGNNVIVTRNSDENGGLIGSLLSQFPQMPQMHHQQAMLGSIGVDGVYRQPCYQLHGMNWYS